VPSTGVSPNPYQSVKGFDGRFDVFAVGQPFPNASFSKTAPELKQQIKYALRSYLPGFAVGKIDVVAQDIGGILITKLANEDPQVAAAIRKLITLNSPFGGSALAKKLIDLRDSAVTFDTTLPKIDPLNPPELSWNALATNLRNRFKVDWCGVAVATMGYTPAFYLGGAVEDIQPGSAELAALTGVPVPTHRMQTTTNELGIVSIGPTFSLSAMWASLGLFCGGLTPDATTVEWTQNLIHAKQIVKTLLSVRSALKEEDPEDRLDGLMKAYKSTVKLGWKDLTDPSLPKPVFGTAQQPVENDRFAESASLLGSLGTDSQAATTIAGDADHFSLTETNNTPASACLANNDFKQLPSDVNGDGTPDAVCRVMWLLEAHPNPSAGPQLFFKNP
jgi:pimeloyl-ACP methyl ester carboxylesterase